MKGDKAQNQENSHRPCDLGTAWDHVIRCADPFGWSVQTRAEAVSK